MHTGIISFADRISFNIKCNDFKDIILDKLYKLYGLKIIQRHYYLLNEKSVAYIKNNKYLCCLRSNGNPYYIFLTKYNDIPIIYFIDKKIHPTYQLPRIIIVKGLFDPNLFNGTLIDGEMVCCYNKKWIFLISDIIAYKGEHLTKFQLPERLTMLNNMLDNEYTEDYPMDICKYRIKPYYNLCVDTLNKISSFEFPFSVRGIYFWAYNLKYKPKLMNIDDDIIQSVSIKTKDNIEFTLKTDNIKSVSKTDLPDIYKVKEDNKYLSIQTIKQSHMLRDAFKDTNLNFTKCIRCSYFKEFDKWIPLSIC